MIKRNHILYLLLTTGLLTACQDKPESQTIDSTPIEFTREGEIYLTRASGDTLKHLEIEIAETPYERETGLMYRTGLERDQGMLFIFENEELRGFHMKNTYIPLDLIFLNADNKIVSIQKEARPESRETIPSERPARYVLEINAGLADDWNLQVGDSLILNRN